MSAFVSVIYYLGAVLFLLLINVDIVIMNITNGKCLFYSMIIKFL